MKKRVLRGNITLNPIMTLDAEFVQGGFVVHVAQRYAHKGFGSDPEEIEADLKRLRRNAAAMNRRQKAQAVPQ